jgi:hypothetical protein
MWHSSNAEGAYLNLYSTSDIQQFQDLLPIPWKINMNGVAEVKDVTSYLLEVRFVSTILECTEVPDNYGVDGA